jgi:protein-disulfide isomerase-like protein with CxxC motif
MSNVTHLPGSCTMPDPATAIEAANAIIAARAAFWTALERFEAATGFGSVDATMLAAIIDSEYPEGARIEAREDLQRLVALAGQEAVTRARAAR